MDTPDPRLAAHHELAAACELTTSPLWTPLRPAHPEKLAHINPTAVVVGGDIVASVYKTATAWGFNVAHQGELTEASGVSITALSAIMHADREITHLQRAADTLIPA